MINNFIKYMHGKVMSHRNGKRLWLQGTRPMQAGFAVGVKYDVIQKADSVELRVNPNGKFTVSRKQVGDSYVPVMDVRLHVESFGVGDRIRAVFYSGMVIVTIHHEQMAKMERETRFINAIQAGATLKEGSLCSGGGISTAAIHDATTQAGVNARVVFVVDEAINYLQVAGVNNYAIDDQTQFFVSKLEEVPSQFIPKVDLLSFSLPCNGLSRSGSAKHKLSPEEHVSATSVFGLAQFIRASNPSILVSENVTEALDSPMYVLIKAEIARLGYRIIEDVTGNEKTGSLESRKRYWFVAVSDGLDAALEEGIFNYLLSRTHASLNDIRDMSADSDESNWCDNSYLKDKQIRDLAAKKGFAKRQLLNGKEENVGTIGKFYAKRRSTEPFWTRADQKERLFSVKEHATVKQIPLCLVKGIPMTVAHEILGQSIDFLQAFMPVHILMRNAISIYRKGQCAIQIASVHTFSNVARKLNYVAF